MLFTFRRRETPWEVVDNRAVEPVPMYYEDEGGRFPYRCRCVPETNEIFADLDIIYVGDNDTVGTYVFDVKRNSDFRDTLSFSRQLLLQEIAKKGLNVLLMERYVSFS
jgi:hypothetical protein